MIPATTARVNKAMIATGNKVTGLVNKEADMAPVTPAMTLMARGNNLEAMVPAIRVTILTAPVNNLVPTALVTPTTIHTAPVKNRTALANKGVDMVLPPPATIPMDLADKLAHTALDNRVVAITSTKINQPMAMTRIAPVNNLEGTALATRATILMDLAKVVVPTILRMDLANKAADTALDNSLEAIRSTKIKPPMAAMMIHMARANRVVDTVLDNNVAAMAPQTIPTRETKAKDTEVVNNRVDMEVKGVGTMIID